MEGNYRRNTKVEKNEQAEKRVTKKRFSAFARRWQDICALILHSFSLFPLLLAKAATKVDDEHISREKQNEME